ncbi:MAG: nucleotide sugar dehydrogenase [Anaerolineae bacterium]
MSTDIVAEPRAETYARASTLADEEFFLLKKIKSRQAVIAIIGMGYVGLPLAVAFAEAGFRVVGIDVDRRRVDSLNEGQSYISDIPTERLAPLLKPLITSNGRLVPTAANGHANDASATSAGNGAGYRGSSSRAGSLSATTDYNVLFDVDAVVICVPTPLDATKEPDVSYIVAAVDEIAHRLHPGMLIVLESTTYPGTTEEILLPRLQQAAPRHNGFSGGNGSHPAGHSPMVVGRDFFLAFSPERIDPGRTDWTVRTTPKVIGGVTHDCLQVAQALYGSAIETVVPVSRPKTAEMVKLLENTFRAVNIGLINEMAMICDQLGIDVWEVIRAASTKPFGFMPFYPGPGLGGHCIPIDPQYLAWKLKTLNYSARFIQLAADINFAMPHYVLSKVISALNGHGKPVSGSKILILGVAYKADVGDVRESPAMDLIALLREMNADVVCSDPHVLELRIDGLPMTPVSLTEETLEAADCVVIVTAHKEYDWPWIVEHSQLIVDTRNATRDVVALPGQVVRL